MFPSTANFDDPILTNRFFFLNTKKTVTWRAKNWIYFWGNYAQVWAKSNRVQRYLILFSLQTTQNMFTFKILVKIIPDSVFDEFKESILDAYDENQDGKLSVQELAEILPTEESFLLLFRMENYLDSCGDFMKVTIFVYCLFLF